MKKQHVFLTMILITAICMPSVSFAWGELGKVDDLIKAGTYNSERLYQAVDILDKLIKEDPGNHTAYFKLGHVYTLLSKYPQANKEFHSACAFKDYNDKVADIFKTECDAALSQGRSPTIKSLHKIIAEWKPDYSSQIEKDIYTRGEILLNGGQIQQSLKYFDLLISLNGSFKDKISDVLFAKEQYDFTSRYSEKHNPEIHSIYVSKMKATSTPQEYNKWRKMALAYGDVKDYDIYKPGDVKIFELKPNGKSDHFIRLSKETMVYFVSRPENSFGLLFRNGKYVRLWQGDKIPSNLSDDFKIIAAKNDVKVALSFRPYNVHIMND